MIFFSWDRLFHSCRIAKSYSSPLPYREHFSVHFQVKALPLFMHSEAVPKKTPLRCSSDHPRGHREDSSWSGWDSQHSSQWDSCWTKCSWQHSPCHSCMWTWTRTPQGSHRDRRWVRWVSLPLCDLSSEHGKGEGSTLCLLFQGTLNGKPLSLGLSLLLPDSSVVLEPFCIHFGVAAPSTPSPTCFGLH